MAFRASPDCSAAIIIGMGVGLKALTRRAPGTISATSSLDTASPMSITPSGPGSAPVVGRIDDDLSGPELDRPDRVRGVPPWRRQNHDLTGLHTLFDVRGSTPGSEVRDHRVEGVRAARIGQAHLV